MTDAPQPPSPPARPLIQLPAVPDRVGADLVDVLAVLAPYALAAAALGAALRPDLTETGKAAVWIVLGGAGVAINPRKPGG